MIIDGPINAILDLSEKVIVRWLLGKQKARVVFRVFGQRLEINVGPESDIDEKILKLDAAKENLQDALNAVDELKTTAELHKQKIIDFERKIERSEKEAAAADKIKQINRDELIELLHIETRQSRLIGSIIGLIVGFILGIGASVIASFIYKAITGAG